MQPQLVSIPLDSLNDHPDFQVRAAGLDAETVERYTQLLRNGVKFRDPIKVGLIVPEDETRTAPIAANMFHLPEGTYVLLDGFHRVEAYRAVGEYEVEAELIACTLSAARWLSAQANMANGLPLHRRDFPNVLAAYVDAGMCWRPGKTGEAAKPYWQIARDLSGVFSVSTVRRAIKKFHPWLFDIIAEDKPPAFQPQAKAPPLKPHERVMLSASREMKAIVKAMALLNRVQRWRVAAEADEVAGTARRLGVKEPKGAEF